MKTTLSHPSRVRELKHIDTMALCKQLLSHPSRVRELKLSQSLKWV